MKTKFLLIKCTDNTWPPCSKSMNKLVGFAVTMNLKMWYQCQEMKKRMKKKSIFIQARFCKRVISKSGGYAIYIQLPFYIETS